MLALVARRGREIGGPTAELAELAGEQERALRRWVSAAGAPVPEGAEVDLGADAARPRRPTGCRSACPPDPVMLSADVAAEIDAAVANALDNVVAHAGAGARAYVLLEDLDDSVVVSVRDDGVGIAAGRLEEAVGEGRVGVSKSIVGRMDWLGGTARLTHRAGKGDRVGTDHSRGGFTVMVVDDHPIWRDAVARDLAEEGFAVVATADGVGSARRRAAVVKPDVVVMDMRLSDGNGAQAPPPRC